MEKKIFELPTEFVGFGEAKNSTFRLIERTNEYYIYERRETFEHYPNRVAVSYEVFKRVVKPLDKFRAQSPKYAEFSHFVRYPSSSQFGLWAWYCLSLKRAKEIINEKIICPNS